MVSGLESSLAHSLSAILQALAWTDNMNSVTLSVLSSLFWLPIFIHPYLWLKFLHFLHISLTYFSIFYLHFYTSCSSFFFFPYFHSLPFFPFSFLCVSSSVCHILLSHFLPFSYLSFSLFPLLQGFLFSPVYPFLIFSLSNFLPFSVSPHHCRQK